MARPGPWQRQQRDDRRAALPQGSQAASVTAILERFSRAAYGTAVIGTD